MQNMMNAALNTLTEQDFQNVLLSLLNNDGYLNPNASYKAVWGDEWRVHLIRVIAKLHEDCLRSHVTEGNDKIGFTLNFSVPAWYTCSADACRTCGDGECYALSEERYPAVVIARYENLNLFVKDPERLEREINAVIEKTKEMRYFRDEKTGKIWSEMALKSELKHRKEEEEKRLRLETDESQKLNEEQTAHYIGMRLGLFIEQLELEEIPADTVKIKFHFRLHESGDFFSVAYLDMWLRIMAKHPDVYFYTYTKQYDVLRKRAAEVLAMPNFTVKISAWHNLPLPQDLLDMGYKVAWCEDGRENRIPKNAFPCPATAGNEMTCERCGYVCTKNCDVKFHIHGNGAKSKAKKSKKTDKAAA